MQTVLPLTPGNPLKNLTGLARQISLPGEHVPLRFPSFPALERTAVMGFNQPASLTLPASTPVAVTLFRQACWPAWADQTILWAQQVEYSCQVVPATVGSPSSVSEVVPLKPALSSWGVANRLASATAPGLTGYTTSPILSYPLVGSDHSLPGAEFTYVPPNGFWSYVVWSEVAPVANENVNVNFEVWSTPGESYTYTASVTIAAGTTGQMNGVIAAPAGHWVRPSSVTINPTAAAVIGGTWRVSVIATTSSTLTYTTSAVTAGSVAVTNVTPLSIHFPLCQPAEFVNSQLPWFATRVTASAFLGTNVSQVLNKGGTILGGRLSPAVYNAWDATSAIVTNLHPAEKAYLPLETGVYTYAPPSTDLVFFTDYTLNTNGGAAGSPVFSLGNDSMYNRMFITASAVAEALACTVSWHLEFRTSSSLFQIGLSAMTLESLHAAQLVLAETGFFFENPEHDGILNKVINTAKKFAPQVVEAVNPMAGRLLSSVISKLSANTPKTVKPKAGPSKPPATSAKASGMLGQTQKGKPKPKGKGKQNKK